MGIKDFYEIIKSECPEAMTTVHLDDLTGMKVAVDISIFLNKYVKTSGPERWLKSFLILMCTLKHHGIKPICIFDGPNPPKEKKEEQERRRSEAAKSREKIKYGRTLIKKIRALRDTKEELTEEIIQEVKDLIGPQRGKRINAINYLDIYDVFASLNDAIDKREMQNQPILPEYSLHAKELIEIMGFPYYQATGEAETLCASMCIMKKVDAVLGEDTDVMAYGTPFTLTKLDIKEKTLCLISHEVILSTLEFSHEEFLDLCILLSCDYNDRAKGYPPDGKKRKKPVGLGAKGAFCMIKEYRRLEESENHIVNPDVLNYRRCRELFTAPLDIDIQIPYTKPIQKEKLQEFIIKHKIGISMDYVLENYKPTPISFGGATTSAKASNIKARVNDGKREAKKLHVTFDN